MINVTSRIKLRTYCGIEGCPSHHHPCLHGSKDTYVTGVNVLLMQQVQAVTSEIPGECVPVNNWEDRDQYIYDSYGEDSIINSVKKTQRETELDDVRSEM